MDYKTLTVKDIVDYINNNPKIFKNGLNTPIWSGDFEGNYTHYLHEISYDSNSVTNVLFLGYEMHEDRGN